MPSLFHGYCHCPGSISGTGKPVGLRNFSAAPVLPVSRHIIPNPVRIFRRYGPSLSQDASVLLSTVSPLSAAADDTASEGLELLR